MRIGPRTDVGQFDESLPGCHLERTSVLEGEFERLLHLALAPGALHIAAAVEVVELAAGLDNVVQRLVMAATVEDLAVVLLGLDHEHIVGRHSMAVGQHMWTPWHAPQIALRLIVVVVAHEVAIALVRDPDRAAAFALPGADLMAGRSKGEVGLRRPGTEAFGLPGERRRMADDRLVVVVVTVQLVYPGSIDAVRTGAEGVHVRQQAFKVGAIVLDVVDHPRRSAGIADQRVDRTEQRDVHRPNGAHWRDAVGYPGVKDRNEPSPAVARHVAVALEFNEDNVSLVDAGLWMLPSIVGHLDRNRGVPRLALVLQQLARERPARPRVDRGRRAGGCAGYRAGTGWWCRRDARLSRGLRTAGKPNADDAQQDRAAADLRHVKVLRPPLRGAVREGRFIVGAAGMHRR